VSGTSKTKMILAVVLIVVVVAGLGVGYMLTQPTFSGIVIGTTDSVELSLDPAQSWDFFGWEMIQSLGSGLVQYKPGAPTGGVADIEPALATSWTLSSDNLSWTFILRQGVKFDDGTEFNATHVKYSIERGMGIADPDGAFLGLGYSDIIKNVTVDSTYQVTFNLNQPYGPFLQFLTMQSNYIIDPSKGGSPPWGEYNASHYWLGNTSKEVQYVEGNANASYPTGLGPYKLGEWKRTAGRDVDIILEPDPYYWDAASYPNLTRVMIKMYADATGLDFAITSGQVDIAFRHLTVPQYNALESNTNVKVWKGTGPFVQYLCFQERRYPWNESEVRQAVACAINRTEICQTVFLGLADPLYSLIPNGMTFHEDAFKNILGTTNITKSKELLALYGYTASNKLLVNMSYETSGHYPQSAELAQTMASELNATGVMTVKLTGWDWSAYKQQRDAHAMDLYVYGWYPDFLDADDYVIPFYQAAGSSWLGTGYNSTVMDQYIDWARYNTSASIRDLNYGKIQNLSVADCPLVPLYHYDQYAVTKLNIHGVVLDITLSWRNWMLYRS
jgi:peptide/nickel transport system substrate-binding protein